MDENGWEMSSTSADIHDDDWSTRSTAPQSGRRPARGVRGMMAQLTAST